MTTVDHVDLRPGMYADSVTLLQVSQRVSQVAGVDAAMVAMATELNLDVIAGMGFAVPSVDPNVLIVAVRASEDALDAALAELDAALAARPVAGGALDGGAPPRTVAEAASESADLVVISTPGDAAFAEALDALEAGLPVMIFSDNMPVAQELILKRQAAAAGLLVMGPDAGTAMVSGVGLGFANVVAPGPVGIVAASGTGAQQVSCLLDDAGVGVSHILGVGGRDLSADIGGLSTMTALMALDQDPATEVIVLLSKPPNDEVVASIRRLTATLDTPVVEGLIGAGADDLTMLATQLAARFGTTLEAPTWGPDEPGLPATTIRGLFAGGTLCDEAMAITVAHLDATGQTDATVRSNVPFGTVEPLTDGLDTDGHLFVDLGEDEFTRGRPHPMIDQRLRIDRLAAEASRGEATVILMDVVLGHAAHRDPAAELAPAIQAARQANPRLSVVISLCGTASDPQDRHQQAQAFVAAGARVAASNATATRIALSHLASAPAAGTAGIKDER